MQEAVVPAARIGPEKYAIKYSLPSLVLPNFNSVKPSIGGLTTPIVA